MMQRLLALFALSIVFAGQAFGAAVVREASGAAAADIQAAVDLFRADIGGGSTPGAAGGFGTPVVRREINWDGVPDASAAPAALAADFFNTTSPRGVVFSTPGTGFQVSATVASGSAVRFGNINPAYSASLAAFSEERLFSAVGSNVVDIDFFESGSANPATVRAFGAVFSDIDLSTSTTIELFDVNGDSLGLFQAPASNGTATFSFLGVSFNAGERIARARIVSGNIALGASVNDNPAGGIDVVTMDDFIYSEPEARTVPGTPTVISPNGGETITIGASQGVSWTPALSGGSVRVELSRNGGSSFETLSASTADDGSESFTFNGPETSQALLRITSNEDRTKSDTSNATFTLSDSGADLAASLSELRIRNGRTVTGTVTITNTGQAAAGAFIVDLYASADSRLTRGDILLRRVSVPSLVVGNTVPVTFSGKLPVFKRRINVLAIVDSGNSIDESVETNNLTSGAATP